MKYYDTFNSKIQCEEQSEVTPEEQAEVFQMMADEHDASQDFAGCDEWLNSLENLEVEEIKDWQGGYTNNDDGPSYNGIAI
jgi:hypothetical protein